MTGGIRWFPQAFVRKLDRDINLRLDVAAATVQNNMISSFRQSNPTGKTPAPEGSPPAVRTTRLRNSILWDVPRKMSRRIGSALRAQRGASASYALMLELGTKNMGARPWARPALDAARSLIKQALKAT